MFSCYSLAAIMILNAGGTTAVSGTVAPMTLSTHVAGYAEHVDLNHQPYWQALPTPAAAGAAGTFEAFNYTQTAPETTAQADSDSEPQENSVPTKDASDKSSGRSPSSAPAGRLRRRPEKPLPTPEMSPQFVGAIASGRSVFTRHMPWALKLKLKLDSAEVGLLDSWQEPDDVHDTSLEQVRTLSCNHNDMCSHPALHCRPCVFM